MSLLHDKLFLIRAKEVQEPVTLTDSDTRVRNFKELGNVSSSLNLFEKLQTRVIENLKASVLLANIDLFSVKRDSKHLLRRLNLLFTLDGPERNQVVHRDLLFRGGHIDPVLVDVQNVDLVWLFRYDSFGLLVVLFREQLHVPDETLVVGDPLLVKFDHWVLLLFGAWYRLSGLLFVLRVYVVIWLFSGRLVIIAILDSVLDDALLGSDHGLLLLIPGLELVDSID